LFSIVIPFHNRKNLLRRSLQSVLNQTYFRSLNPIQGEILLVDDGSDPLEEIRFEFLEEIVSKGNLGRVEDFLPLRLQDFPNEVSMQKALVIFSATGYELPVFLLRKANGGASSARNLGVRMARGEWIYFIDSDDEWKKEKLAKQIQYGYENPEIRIHQTREDWIRKGRYVNPQKKHRKLSGDLFQSSLELCMITPSSVCIQKTLWEEMGGMDEDLPACEDYDLWLGITARYPVGLLEESLLIRYGGETPQLSQIHPVLDRFRIYSLLKRSPEFTESQKEFAKKVLVRKLKILIQGRKKRKKDFKVLEEILAWIETRYGSKDERISGTWKHYLLNPSPWNGI